MSFNAVAAAAFLLFSAPVFAQDYVVLDQRASEFNNWQGRVDANYGPTTIISRETNVPVAVIEEQRTRTSLGYGELLIANSLAVETGRSFDDIIAYRTRGYGWGKIARENRVNLGHVVSRLDRASVDFRDSGNLKRDRMKAAKFVNGHDARDGKFDDSKPGKAFSNGNGKGKGKRKAKGKGKK